MSSSGSNSDSDSSGSESPKNEASDSGDDSSDNSSSNESAQNNTEKHQQSSDSESSVTSPTKPKRRQPLSDDEVETAKVQRNEDGNEITNKLHSLFGSESEDSESEQANTSANLSKSAQLFGEDSDGDVQDDVPDEVAGDQTAAIEEEEEEEEENRIQVEIPKVCPAFGEEQYFVKLPNFLSVETRPFDPTQYEDEIDEDDILDEEGRSRLKLRVENTIRWRSVVNEEGVESKESNARIVRWSDGSMTLHLGKEMFDVHRMPIHGDFNHLFVRQGTGLQGMAVFHHKLVFRPHSTDSITHRKMTLSLAERSNKKQQIKVLPMAGKDPEALRGEMIKREDEKLKASLRRESQQRRIRERQQMRGLNKSFLENKDSDEEDDNRGVSIRAIKSQFHRGNKPIYSSSEDEPEPKIEKGTILSSSDSDESDDAPKAKRRAKVLDEESD